MEKKKLHFHILTATALRRVLAAAFSVLLLITAFPLQSFARDYIDVDHICSLKIALKYDNVRMEGFDLRVHRVASVSANGAYTLTATFAPSAVKLNGLDAEGWRVAAATLSSYEDFNRPAPDYTGKTDRAGTVQFTDMSTGLYLVKLGQVKVGSYIYAPQPFLVSLPDIDKTDNDTWVYDVTSEPKISRTGGGGGGGGGGSSYSYRVIKAWKEDDPEKRPDSVEVVLMKDGEPCDYATLSSMNGWASNWYNLEKDHTYTVTEKVIPAGYTVTVEQLGSTFTVTNTGSGAPKPPAGPLPQTGLLWWPLPVVIIAGLFFIGLGILINRKKEKQQ